MTHFELLKYAATGIASQDMTAYDKMRALAMAGGKVKTLTGVPPLSFRANGKPLISWSMLGNSQQNGTPSPDAPIMPQFVGERNGNLFDADLTVGTINVSDGTESPYDQRLRSGFVSNSKLPAGTYSLSANGAKLVFVYLYSTKTNYYGTTSAGWSSLPYTFTTNNNYYIRIVFRDSPERNMSPASVSNIMLNLGSTALPYEPYGFYLPITCAGQTTPIYLGQTQTVRKIKKLVLTGQEETTRADTGGMYRYIVRTTLRYADKYIGLSTHYQYNFGTPSVYGYFHILSDGTGLAFFDNRDISADAFKQWLSDQYSAGTPVTVWYILATPEIAIVNEPLAKIGDYADELHSEDAGVSIPTARGQNTLTVDTDLQPSEMTITYR